MSSIDRERWQRISPVLEAALDLPADARAAWLDAACGDAALRRDVEELLAAEQAGGSFLASSALERAAPLLAAEPLELPEEAGERRAGAYRLLSALGEGGMGAVYLAERVDGQFEQQVAVKVLKRGLVGEGARRRFLRERQILARLEHPGIARLLDGGVTAEEAPFFVMERVLGRPLTVFCDEERLGIEDRLRVFLQVCDAVHYAHRNLVVHRDLKPSNILVDGAGRVKLLDFGIAKLLVEGAADPTRTTLGAMTPEYASPEQVRGDHVTTATDVYSLGILLYEILTGQRPYRVARGSAAEVERAILDQDPLRPSAGAAAGAGLPGLGPRETGRRLRGDLDGIVLQALQKPPERRYPSVDALAADLRRHLDGLPVSARPDHLRSRLRRLVRRHRVAVAASALVVFSLVVGLLGTAWQARRAEAEARKASAAKDFLKSLFAASEPAKAQGRALTAKDLLDDGARRIEAELAAEPEVRYEVRRLIASVYVQLGAYEQARPLLSAELEQQRRLAGPRSVAVAELLTDLGEATWLLDRYDEARPLYEEALGIMTERRGPRSREAARLLSRIGALLADRGDFAGAEEALGRALAIFDETGEGDSRESMGVREGLGITYASTDRYAEASRLQARISDWRERHLGPAHPGTLTSRYNQAAYLIELGRAAEAASILEGVLAERRRVLGPRHDHVALTLKTLASARDAAGRTEEALPLVEESVAIHRELFGPAGVQTVLGVLLRARLLARTARLDEAQRDCRAALALVAANANFGARRVAGARSSCGSVAAEAGRLDEADAWLEQAVTGFRASGLQGAVLARALDARSDVARRQGRLALAVELGREAVAVQLRVSAPDNPRLALHRVRAGAALWASGRRAEGEALLREGVATMERAFPAGHFDLAAGRLLLGGALATSGRTAEARALLQAALDWRLEHLGASDPRTIAARQALARAPS
jgi:eukaryotic-like serine/threonine-protein kinase